MPVPILSFLVAAAANESETSGSWVWTYFFGRSPPLGGCGTRHRLAEYDFRGLTLAVEPHFPPFPEVLTGPYFPGHPRDPIHAIIRAGTLLAKELEAREVRVRLDSAATLVDLPALVGERLGRESARNLGARLIDDVDAADLVLEVVGKYGADGIQFDDHTTLPREFGYDPFTVALYRKETGRNPPANPADPAWVKWRADKITAFMDRLSKAVRAPSPWLNCLKSAASASKSRSP